MNWIHITAVLTEAMKIQYLIEKTTFNVIRMTGTMCALPSSIFGYIYYVSKYN